MDRSIRYGDSQATPPGRRLRAASLPRSGRNGHHPFSVPAPPMPFAWAGTLLQSFQSPAFYRSIASPSNQIVAVFRSGERGQFSLSGRWPKELREWGQARPLRCTTEPVPVFNSARPGNQSTSERTVPSYSVGVFDGGSSGHPIADFGLRIERPDLQTTGCQKKKFCKGRADVKERCAVKRGEGIGAGGRESGRGQEKTSGMWAVLPR